MSSSCLPPLSLLFLSLLFVSLISAGDFDFKISPRFRNAIPQRDAQYFDYCGFDCTKYPGVRVVNADDFCNAACRSTDPKFYGPFCYRNNQCPSLFNAKDPKSDIHLRWGQPHSGEGMSGMGFSPVKTNSMQFGGTFDVQKEFKLGDLTHYNWPIGSGSNVKAFDFVFNITISRGGTEYLNSTEVAFSMIVDETPNAWRQTSCNNYPACLDRMGECNKVCPFPSRFGCNPTPPECPDRIHFTSQISSNTTFTLNDGVKYTLAIVGFKIPTEIGINRDFVSDEAMSSTVGVYAVVTRACPDCAKAGLIAIFNQSTFTCECECDREKKAAECKPPTVLLPSCECGCPETTCPPGERPILKNGVCKCECDPANPKVCPKGFVPGPCNGTQDGCCCNCEKDCGNAECYNSTCEVRNGQTICKVNSFDGQACGDMDLCSNRCLDSKCTPFDLTVVSNRCSPPPPECGECCTYACEKKTGKCVMTWSKVNATCSDNNICTTNDRCVPNPGNTTVPLVCRGESKCSDKLLGKPSRAPCTQWQCSTGQLGACVEVPINQTGVTCAALGFCTENGTCSEAGECLRPRKQCQSTDPCQVPRCREDLKKCELVPQLANGLPCDDKDNCTTGDICVDGACQGSKACNDTPPGTPPLVPLIVTAAVVAAAALVAGFFVYQAINKANIMDPVSWGEINSSQFDANPLYKEATQFGDNPLYQS